ncbi:hypothetical protein [Halobaculum sp. EA56]|uniref:hypothetical protein n=1 Tax=Halobaculum sp. EA56 TaxID=3421648 RepID=UPI003EBFECAF
MVGFCEPDDVRQVLQKRELTGTISASMITPAITGVSGWFARQTNGHWYDSSAASGDEIDTTAASATGVRLDVPSGPHRKDRQLFHDDTGARYPTTTHGPYAKIRLPHPYVQTVTALLVRGRGGDVDDWVASAEKTEGRGEDYYIEARGQDSYGRTYLYIRAASIGARVDYDGLLTLEYDYGLDAQDTSWDDVRRGVALLAAAQVVSDDDVLTAIPDNGQLIGVATQRDQHVADAIGEAWSLLSPYLSVEVR